MPMPWRPNFEMTVRVNGEEWGRGHSSEMHWKFEECIAHVSRGLEHMKFLKPGDVVELEVERIGVLRNRVLR